MQKFLRFVRWCLFVSLFVSRQATAQQAPVDTLNEAPRYTHPITDSLANPGDVVVNAVTDPWSRTAVIADYYQNYIGSAVSDNQLNWTGNLSGCVPGMISQLAQDRTLQRINYYRRLVGLPDNMTFDPSRNTDTQAAALIMAANNNLSHAPPSTWLCYTPQGYNGAANSNLALGSHSSQAVKQFMDDNGNGNEIAGHRRWILYSRAASFGHGSARTNSNGFGFSDALWVFNLFVTPVSLPAYVAFPPAGFVPRTLIPPRWSFSIPGATFSSASVTVQDQTGTPLALTTHPVSNGAGDNTLVWNLDNAATDLAWNGSADKSFRVTVSGVVLNGVTQPPYSYTVVAIDPAGAGCPGPSPVASCSVAVSGGQSIYYGTENFRFNTIDNQSSTSSSDGYNYLDLSCVTQTTVTAGSSYTVSVKGIFTNSHQLRVWIDYNGNGVFTDAGEQVLTSSANSATAVVAIPQTATVNTLLRIRVMADSPSSAGTPCALTGSAQYGAGQMEDYGLWIQSSSPPCTVMTTVRNGNWTSPDTWSCNRVPTATDQVQVGHVVTVGAGVTALATKIVYQTGGRVSFLTGAQLKLAQ
ncbi:CAP domain-containing protein [Spirosoma agri]|uniref:CAP domain-containing protein n=1 Tax=Spirosoma agri TaxID=1987381 RepID=A0A6M0IQU4_9BACT|nr:CAP domain-containing protein [Spirosoma agri]NEU70658.1 CAP domain-containing protein [Spirosoma agri]